MTDAYEAMRHADLAMLLSPDLPIGALHSLAASCDERCQAAGPLRSLDCGASLWIVPSKLPSSTKVPRISTGIERVACRDLPVTRFREEFLRAGRPVVVEGHTASAEWKAANCWSDLRLWAERHGHRSVPVEMGFQEKDAANAELAASTEAEGSMFMADFVGNFLVPSNAASQDETSRPEELPDEWSSSPVAYMAQHQLLMQIPELRSDIAVPHYCALGKLQTLNIWMGTAGTVTALHYDLDDNFLVQVAGFKYVRLYAAQESQRLYATEAPRDASRKHGESFPPVRVEKPDLEAHPEFANVPFMETILGPGDMLFIPRVCNAVTNKYCSC